MRNWTFYFFSTCVVFSTRAVNQEKCAVNELSVFKQAKCSDRNAVTINVHQSLYMAHGTSCVVHCKEGYGKGVKQCRHGQWEGNEVVCKSKILQRKKRGWFRRGGGPPPPPLDETPPDLNCPGDVEVTAGPRQTTASASWSVPSAEDAMDGPVSAVLTSDKGPGSVFNEGSTRVEYTAEDAGGNSASCSFNVYVTVVKCRSLYYSGRYSCSYNNIYGSSCSFKCDATGYELEGRAHTTCLSSGDWSSAVPECKRVYCGNPGDIANGDVIGTGFSYGDSVRYVCNTHHNLTGPSSRTCQANRIWSKEKPECIFVNSCGSSPCENGATCENLLGDYHCTCLKGWSGRNCETDVLYPTVDQCTDRMNVLTSEETTQVEWPIPHFQDPFGNGLLITSNYDLNVSTFPWGDHTVQYTAVKENNGLGTECSFPICVRPHSCVPLPVSNGGALLCNGWKRDYASLCLLVCLQGHMYTGNSVMRQLYICGATGVWSPPDTPQCIETKIPPEEFEGVSVSSCEGEENRQLLAQYYINRIKESEFSVVCSEFPDLCDVNNVEIQC